MASWYTIPDSTYDSGRSITRSFQKLEFASMNEKELNI